MDKFDPNFATDLKETELPKILAPKMLQFVPSPQFIAIDIAEPSLERLRIDTELPIPTSPNTERQEADRP
jgi:hypothetical protein